MYYGAVILARVCVFTRARVGRASAFPEFRIPRVSRARVRELDSCPRASSLDASSSSLDARLP